MSHQHQDGFVILRSLHIGGSGRSVATLDLVGELLLWSFCAAGFGPSSSGGGFALARSDGTGGMSPLPSNVPYPGETYYSKPAWSPDGGFIAFSSPGLRSPAHADALYIMRLTSPNAIRLGLGTRPAWRPAR
jgi:hypothetical protein